jgi:hypothetical protein
VNAMQVKNAAQPPKNAPTLFIKIVSIPSNFSLVFRPVST